jgi:hypothetical protein
LIGNAIHHGRAGGEQVSHGFGPASSRSHCLTRRARVALGNRRQGLWTRRQLRTFARDSERTMASDRLAELTSLSCRPHTIQSYYLMLSLQPLSQPSSKLSTKPSSKPSNEPSSKHWRHISSRRRSRILVSDVGGSLGTLRSGRRIVLDLRGSLGRSGRWIDSDVGGSLGRSGRLIQYRTSGAATERLGTGAG